MPDSSNNPAAIPEAIPTAIPEAIPTAIPTAVPTAPRRPALTPFLASLWNRHTPLMRERLSALDAAATAAQAGQLDAAQHALALDAAHKFAGSLGMFGFHEGTDAAREIEHRLLAEETPASDRITQLIRHLHQLLQL